MTRRTFLQALATFTLAETLPVIWEEPAIVVQGAFQPGDLFTVQGDPQTYEVVRVLEHMVRGHNGALLDPWGVWDYETNDKGLVSKGQISLDPWDRSRDRLL